MHIRALGALTTADVERSIDAESLGAASGVRIFFGHQSVGANLIDGIPGAYAIAGSEPPAIVLTHGSEPVDIPGGTGFVAHTHIGQNGDPLSKLRAFDALVRSGPGQGVDVALMKFCYVDVHARTDTRALFADYQTTLAALQSDFRGTAFLHVTTPLTTSPGLKNRVKTLLGGESRAADNATREEFNELLRNTYAPEKIFDLAALQSTTPDGSRVVATRSGREYYSLFEGYASDAGHLNTLGSQYLAAELMAAARRATA